MTYSLVLMNGREYEINQQEYDMVKGKVGIVYLPRLELSFNMASVSVIEPKGMGKRVDRTKQLEGVTPEGDIVVKRFGVWYFRDVNEYQRDEEGRSILRWEGSQLLPSPEEYEQEFKQLASSEWTKRLIGRSSEIDDRLLIDRSGRVSTDGLSRIGAPTQDNAYAD